MKKWALIFGFLMSTVLISCQYDPYAHKYTTIQPKEFDIVGTYTFDKQTVDYDITAFTDSVTNQVVIPKIEIHSNGTYTVTNLPVFETFDPTYIGLISTSGNWEILTVGSIGDGNGNSTRRWGIYLRDLPNDMQNAGLLNNESPYGIIFGFGDPDAGQAVLFKKQ